MSRVGQAPVVVPGNVEIEIAGRRIKAKGKLGELTFDMHPDVEAARDGNFVRITPRNDSKRARQLWGTTRNQVANLVAGVSQGFTRRLDITGVGYRAAVQGKALNLQLGYSHEVAYAVPEGITITCETPTAIVISGADKQRVGQVAAEIRSYRPPEPYKGKGVRYSDEVVLRKEGKKK